MSTSGSGDPSEFPITFSPGGNGQVIGYAKLTRIGRSRESRSEVADGLGDVVLVAGSILGTFFTILASQPSLGVLALASAFTGKAAFSIVSTKTDDDSSETITPSWGKIVMTVGNFGFALFTTLGAVSYFGGYASLKWFFVAAGAGFASKALSGIVAHTIYLGSNTLAGFPFEDPILLVYAAAFLYLLSSEITTVDLESVGALSLALVKALPSLALSPEDGSEDQVTIELKILKGPSK